MTCAKLTPLSPQFLEDREAGFQREMLFCKLNSIMPRLRHPPVGRIKLKIYKCALVCEAVVLVTAVMLNTHGITANAGEACSGLLLLLALAEGPLQLEISGAPFRVVLLIAIHFVFTWFAMIPSPAFQLSPGFACFEITVQLGAQVAFHLDDKRCAQRAAENPFFVSVPNALTLARAIYGNRYISRPGYVPPRGVLVNAGVKQIHADFVQLDGIGFLYNPVNAGEAYEICPTDPSTLLRCESRPPRPFTMDDFDAAWSDGGISHQAELSDAVFRMLDAWALALPLHPEKWAYLERCELRSLFRVVRFA